MLLAFLSGILLAVVGVTTAPPLLHLMQVPDSILPLAALYLRIYFLGMPAAMLYNFGAALLRSVGDTRRPLYYLIAAGVLNVALNLLLVIGIPAAIRGIPVTPQVASVDIPLGIGVMLLLAVPILVKKRGYRWQGALLLVLPLVLSSTSNRF